MKAQLDFPAQQSNSAPRMKLKLKVFLSHISLLFQMAIAFRERHGSGEVSNYVGPRAMPRKECRVIYWYEKLTGSGWVRSQLRF